MLALARDNQRRVGVENVEFLKGEIEAVPLQDTSVDAIEIEPARVYDGDDAHDLLPSEVCESPEALDGAFMSAFVRVVKPFRKSE